VLPVEGLHVVSLDTEWGEIAQESGENVESGVWPEDLAYVIYTSGSTGKPKGVMNSHAGLCNRMWWMYERYPLNENDRVLQKTPYSFDISLWEFLWPLMSGARLVVARPEGHRDSEYLVNLIEQAGITTVHFVPSMLQVFLEEPGLERCKSLRRVICSGEALTAELQERFFARFEKTELLNLYGPTEAAIEVTYWECERNSERRTVPIGRPISNIQVYVLDRYMNPVPAAVLGELHIGGVGVARGYRNRAELTAEKFVPDPFGKAAGARLYKTGDLARYGADGVIESAGRIDNQVKIRGFRIELGEIEAALAEHEGVSKCVVLSREDKPGQKRLVAYVVAQKEPKPTTTELRNWLKERVPEYMVPAVFVLLEAIPVTTNGKLDRSALPMPDAARPQLEQSYVAPRTEAEEKLARIWGEVLKLERIGVQDNFFELGGDSILAIQIISRANQAGLGLTARKLFQHQTIAELATMANAALPVQAEQDVVMGAVPLTAIQRWFFEQELTCPEHWNQGVLVQVREPVQVEALRRALEHIVAHHDALRLRFARGESGWEQVNQGLGAEASLGIEDLSEVPRTQLSARIENLAAQCQDSLNLATGPLFRVVLFRTGASERDRLLIVVHHLAVDGVSWRILLEDLQNAYAQAKQGQSIQLLPKTTSFKKWAEELNGYGPSTASGQGSDFWLKQTWTAVRPVPVDRSGGLNTEGSVKFVTVSLTPAETEALLRDVPAAYHTQINDVLLTALTQTLGAWTGSDSIALDLEGHGREEILPGVDVSRTVGWFTSIFPVCLRSAASDQPGVALKSIKEQLRVIPGRGVNYGILRYLGPTEVREKLKTIPQPQVQFNYLGQFDNVMSASSLLLPANEAMGPCQDPRNIRRYLLQINAGISAAQLQAFWNYSENVHSRETVESLATRYLQALRTLIAHCQNPDAGGYTPSDFPLVKLTQKELAELTGNSPLVRDIYPLSPTQQGLLFHTLSAPDSGTYFMQLSFKLEGEFEADDFEAAWREVIARHAALRTAFRWQETDEPLQIVYEKVDVACERLDWSHSPEAEQAKLLREYLKEQRGRRFDLERAPLVRLTLIHLGNGAYQFVWGWSHLILDGWCVPLVLRELFFCYQEKQGRTVPSLRVSPPYRDYIAWLQRQDLAKAEAHWRKTLKDFAAPTPLPSEQSSRDSGSGEYKEQHIYVSAAASEQIQAFARHEQITMNVIAQAAWGLLLSRYAGERDVVFGATLSGRPAELPDVEAILGLFITTLPVRVRIAETDLAGPWLRRLQAEQAELREFEYSPLVQVQEWSEVPAGTALFESILVFENYPIDSSGEWTHGLRISNVQSQERTNYPLTLMVVPGKQISVRALYDGGRFDDGAIAAVLQHYSVLLESLAVNADGPVCKIVLVTQEEKRQHIVARNNTATAFSEDASIAELFEMQVQRTPEAIAVTCGGDRVSYRELSEQSTRLGSYLREKGAGAGSLVAICLERSVDMVVGLFGILKAGAAYVPVDPTYPAERVLFMLQDAGVKMILTEEKLLENLPQTGAPAVCQDRHQREIFGSSREPLPRVDAESLAYVMYTSGSTGKPKGVMVRHRSVVNFLESMCRKPGITADDVMLAITTLSFDIAGLELYAPLIAGARVEIAPREVAVDPALLSRKMREVRATVMQATPATWRMLVDSGWKGQRNLRILCGGEALAPELASELLSRGESVWNLYGPTETTIWSAVHQVTRVDSSSVPIGHPIANTQIYILDKDQNLVPEGVPGELYIAGVGLAQGYLNRAELTTERFVPEPFSEQPGALMYRTGDLARYRSDGALEHLGRLDYQVKVRGHRIELGEIEAILEEHEGVAQAVAVARETSAGDTRLIAYFTVLPGHTLSSPELMSHLKSQLPAHMIPSVFVQLESFPLTPNGKIDRKALPAPQQPVKAPEAQSVAATTGLEIQLQNIWERVLGVRPIGTRDNFFELGGHSLLAIRLFAQMEKVFGKNIPLATLFQAPTIEEFAEVLRREDWASAWSSLVALQPNGSAPPFFCVHSLGANLVSYAQLARHVGLDQPFHGLQPIGLDGKETPHTRIEDMAAHYLREIRAIQPEGPYYLGGVCLGGVVAFEMSQQLQAAGQEVALLLLVDAGFPGRPKHMVERVQWNGGLPAVADYYLGEVLLRSPKERAAYVSTRVRNIGRRLAHVLSANGNSNPYGEEMSHLEELMQRVKEANNIAGNSYVPQYYPGKITFLWCSDTPLRSYRDRRMAWSQVAGGGLEVHAIPGNHLTMVDYPHVVAMAEELRNCLRNAQPRQFAMAAKA
jgi:amino acid adenylation domain-containing protein/non-ribosomal peptide synthase protein (TIGR01720 family)